MPVAPARWSVWQDAHFWTNSSLPLTVFVPLSLSAQPPNASAIDGAAGDHPSEAPPAHRAAS